MRGQFSVRVRAVMGISVVIGQPHVSVSEAVKGSVTGHHSK